MVIKQNKQGKGFRERLDIARDEFSTLEEKKAFLDGVEFGLKE